MVSYESMLEYLISAIPHRLRNQLPYEESVELIADRWVYAANRADPENSFISLLMLYMETNPNSPHLFSDRTKSIILNAVRRRLGQYTTINNDFVSGVLSFYEKGVPLERCWPLVDLSLRIKAERSVRIVALMGWNFCSDASPEEFNHVMNQKITVPYHLTHDSSIG